MTYILENVSLNDTFTTTIKCNLSDTDNSQGDIVKEKTTCNERSRRQLR
jgi:hypothetical protein